jgi:hypothetical protein
MYIKNYNCENKGGDIMSRDWGPHYIVPTEVIEKYSGVVMLREEFDEKLLHKELDDLNISGHIALITNPWYYRRKNTDTWIKIGESSEVEMNFPVKWDTAELQNGNYEVMGLMHVYVKEGTEEKGIARQNIVEVNVENLNQSIS